MCAYERARGRANASHTRHKLLLLLSRTLDWSPLQCFMRQTRTQHFALDPSHPSSDKRRTTAAKENMKKQTEAGVAAGAVAVAGAGTGANNT